MRSDASVGDDEEDGERSLDCGYEGGDESSLGGHCEGESLDPVSTATGDQLQMRSRCSVL